MGFGGGGVVEPGGTENHRETAKTKNHDFAKSKNRPPDRPF